MHKVLGPGLLESVCHLCMIHEMQSRRINFETELTIPVKYENLELDADLRCDLLVENALVVEFKSVEKVLPIHTA